MLDQKQPGTREDGEDRAAYLCRFPSLYFQGTLITFQIWVANGSIMWTCVTPPSKSPPSGYRAPTTWTDIGSLLRLAAADRARGFRRFYQSWYRNNNL